MALATRCPHCHTTFRVAQDQLKLRSGLVRCGACKQIFNGADHLLQPERQSSPSTLPAFLEKAAHAPASSPASAPQPPFAAPVAQAAETPPAAASSPAETIPHTEEEAPPKEFADFSEFLTSSAADTAEPSGEPESIETPPGETAEDPLQRITLIDFSEVIPEEETPNASPEKSAEDIPASPNTSEAAISNIETKNETLGTPETHEPDKKATAPAQGNPVRAKTLDELRPGFRPTPAETPEEDEPEFVRKGRRKQRLARTSRIVMSVGSLLLLIGLIGQGAYAFRDILAAASPKMKVMLTQACQSLGCEVRLPAQIDGILLESSDFQSLPDHANTLVLTMLLRNQSRTVQAWPQIELTLNDANDKPIARRVLSPQDYLPAGQDPKQGFPSHSEQPVKTYLQVSQLKPDGYRLYLFYP